MEQIYEGLIAYIDICYLFIFIFLSYMVKKQFGVLLNKATKFEWRAVYTVLILAALVAIPFLLFTDTKWQKIVLSYALGTSLYETIFEWIENKSKDNGS